MIENATNLTNVADRASGDFWGVLSDYSQELLALAAIITIILVVIKLVFKWYSQRKNKKADLRDFSDELKFNKRKTKKEDRNSYQFSAYEKVKTSHYLLELSPNLRENIYDAYGIIESFRTNPQNVHFQKRIPELKKLLEDIIPEFEEYLKRRRVEK